MSYQNFEYLSPTTKDEVCAFLNLHGEKAMLMAGGTDLLIKIKARRIQPTYVIGLKKVAHLDEMSFDPDKGLTIGATSLLVSIAANPQIQKYYPALAYGAKETATVQIRNMASLVANVCNASPSADTSPSLLALNAAVNITSSQGERQLPLNNFFIGPGKIALEKGEFASSIFVPIPVDNSGCSYHHISARSKVDIPAASVSVSVTVKEEKMTNVRIVLGAVGPTVFRATQTESLLNGKMISDTLLDEVAIAASSEARPISDIRATADYRRKMIAILTKRAVKEAVERALINNVGGPK